MKKVALYCRVSSEKQKEKDTIENQIDILRTFVEMKDNLEIYNEYLDDGISGTIPFENRPNGKKVLDSAKSKDFDSLLVWKIDRLGRDTLSGLQAAETLSNYGIEIISVTEPFDLNTPIGRFQFINYLNMAELERNNILDRMFLGATRAAKKGKWMGGIVPYGYFKNKDGYLEINEPEAVIVRKIYDMYVNDRMNSADIAIYLENCGITCNYASKGNGKNIKVIDKKKSKWSLSTVQRIINSKTYAGIHEYGKRASRRKELVIRHVPAIIPLEVYDMATKLRSENRLKSMKNTKTKFMLRGLLECGNCHYGFSGITYEPRVRNVYSCRGKLKINRELYNVNCNMHNLKQKETEEYVWNQCKYFMKNFDNIIVNSNSNKKLDYESELDAYNIKLNSLDKEKENILKLYRKNIIDEIDLAKQLKDINKESSRVKKLINEIKNNISNIENKDMKIKETKNFISLYINRIDGLSIDEKILILNYLIKKIIVTETIENKEIASYLDIYYKISDLTCARTNVQVLNQTTKIHYKQLPEHAKLLRQLRLNNEIKITELSEVLNTTYSSLLKTEMGRTKYPQKIYHLYAKYFNVDPVQYFKFYNLPEKTVDEKVTKILYYLNLNNKKDVYKMIGRNGKYNINLYEDKLNKLLENVKKSYKKG